VTGVSRGGGPGITIEMHIESDEEENFKIRYPAAMLKVVIWASTEG
jgi:hypothetical protein